MDFFDLVEKRRAVREFSSKTVSKEQEEKLLKATMRAPSAGNRQAYRILAVKSAEKKEEIAFACLEQEFIASAPLVLVFIALPEVSGAKYGSKGRQLFSVQDATLAAAYCQLAAAELGLATCWVGAFEDEKLAKACGLKENEKPVAVVPVGYAGDAPSLSSRRPLEKVVENI
ncbi:nitroreductase family protein [Candidatus Micrarchaeota archaeon]|nr:nitroreductase family protein [Candidatus Micrarchaeota archaeon]